MPKQNRKKRENEKNRRDAFLRAQYLVEEWEPVEELPKSIFDFEMIHNDDDPYFIDHLLAKPSRSKYIFVLRGCFHHTKRFHSSRLVLMCVAL